jgi:hypothetical protein
VQLAAVEADAQAHAPVATPEQTALASVQIEPLCAHCLGRSVPAPLLLSFAQGQQAAQRAAVAPALVTLKLALPVATHATVFAPPQHAPPPRARRHLLLNVLLI